MVDDEPIALTEEQLERLRGIADDFQNPKCVELLSELRAGDPSRTWMDNPHSGPTPVTDADLKAAANWIRTNADFTGIETALTELLGQSPTKLVLTRFVRMIAPAASLEVAIKATDAVTRGDGNEVSALLTPYLRPPA